LKEQVRRNIDRFPKDFMFELSNKEFRNLRSQIAASSWDDPRYVPMAFTEQGVAMLSSVLQRSVYHFMSYRLALEKANINFYL
jgi:hypothetical protein